MLQKDISNKKIPCPYCSTFIDINLEGGEYVCPECGMKIIIAQKGSDAASEAIKKLKDREKW